MTNGIQIAHEAPMSLMPLIRQVTDYDYALVHLFEDPEIGEAYKNFFQESMKMGRKVILDNSIFELGEAFDVGHFFYWVEKLLPTEYIIPDVFQDCRGTLTNVDKWFELVESMNPELLNKCNAIAVVQGNTEKECIECYKALSANPKIYKIAIPFDLPWYQAENKITSKEIAFMEGRRIFIHKLNELNTSGTIKNPKPLHLLGCALPQEFEFYKEWYHRFSNIQSIDTSNPVLHGIEGIRYKPFGLELKSKTKMADVMKNSISAEGFATVFFNVGTFRTFVK